MEGVALIIHDTMSLAEIVSVCKSLSCDCINILSSKDHGVANAETVMVSAIEELKSNLIHVESLLTPV